MLHHLCAGLRQTSNLDVKHSTPGQQAECGELDVKQDMMAAVSLSWTAAGHNALQLNSIQYTMAHLKARPAH